MTEFRRAFGHCCAARLRQPRGGRLPGMTSGRSRPSVFASMTARSSSRHGSGRCSSCFLSHPGRVLQQRPDCRSLFTFDEQLSPNAIEVHVPGPRTKIEPAGTHIRTVRGFGYLWEARMTDDPGQTHQHPASFADIPDQFAAVDGFRAAIVTYWVASRSANNAYDRSLSIPAFDIADNVSIDAHGAHVDLPRKALGRARTRPGRQGDLSGAIARRRDHRWSGRYAAAPAFSLGAVHFLRQYAPRRKDPCRGACGRRTGLSCRSAKRCTSAIAFVGEILAAELVPALLIAAASIAASPGSALRAALVRCRIAAIRNCWAERRGDLRPLSRDALPQSKSLRSSSALQPAPRSACARPTRCSSVSLPTPRTSCARHWPDCRMHRSSCSGASCRRM